jgi:hypothetical protein
MFSGGEVIVKKAERRGFDSSVYGIGFFVPLKR